MADRKLVWVFGIMLATQAIASTPDPDYPAVTPELATLLRQAQKALGDGDAQKALTLLRNWSGEPHTLQLLAEGHALRGIGQLREAEAAYRKAHQMSPNLREAQMGLAAVLIESGKARDAQLMLAEKFNPDQASSLEHLLYAQAAFAQGDFQLSSLLTERAMLRFPKDTHLRRLHLQIQLKTQNTKSAEATVRTILQETPTDALAWQNLAALTPADDSSARLAALEAAHFAAPNDLALLKLNLEAQLSARHYSRAYEFAQKAVARGQKSGSVDTTIAELAIHAALQNKQQAQAQDWLKTLPKDQHSPRLLRVSAQLALTRGDEKTAQQSVEALIQLEPNNPELLLLAGQLAEKSKDHVSASAWYQRAIDTDKPNSRRASLQLARLFHQTHQSPRAEAVLQRHLAQFPNDTEAATLLEAITPKAPDSGYAAAP